MSGDEPVDLEYEAIKHETDKAKLYDFGDGMEVWLPKSKIEVDDGDGNVVIPRWLAEAKDLA
jgi:hypothetical protein